MVMITIATVFSLFADIATIIMFLDFVVEKIT